MQNLFQMQIGVAPSASGQPRHGKLLQRVKRLENRHLFLPPTSINVLSRALVKGFMDGRGVDLMLHLEVAENVNEGLGDEMLRIGQMLFTAIRV